MMFNDVANVRVRAGDWSAAGWYSGAIDELARKLDTTQKAKRIAECDGIRIGTIREGDLVRAITEDAAQLHGYIRRGTGSQTRLRGQAEPACIKRYAELVERRPDGNVYRRGALNERQSARLKSLIAKWTEETSGHLMITSGQNTISGRVSAVVEERLEWAIGAIWRPIPGLSLTSAQALAVYMNSTLGRIELLRNRGKSLEYAVWTPRGLERIQVPMTSDDKAIDRLAACYQETAGETVPRYDEGYTDIRRSWDKAASRGNRHTVVCCGGGWQSARSRAEYSPEQVELQTDVAAVRPTEIGPDLW